MNSGIPLICKWKGAPSDDPKSFFLIERYINTTKSLNSGIPSIFKWKGVSSPPLSSGPDLNLMLLF